MILSQLTIVSPEGPSVTLGSWTTDSSGNAHGLYAITSIKMDPAPTVALVKKLPLFNGAVIASGLKDSRKVSITGTVFAGSQDEANTMLRNLQIACDTSLNNGLTALQFTPVSTLPQMQLLGIVTQLTVDTPVGSTCGFSINFEAGLPYPTSVVSSVVSSPTNANATVTVVGDDIVYPKVSLSVAAGLTSLNVQIVGQLNTTIHLTGLVINTTSTIVIDSTPGYESVTINGVGIRGVKTLASTWLSMYTGSNTVSVGSVGTINSYSVTWNEAWKI